MSPTNEHRFLFASFAEKLKKRILAGYYPVNSYLPSIRKLQEQFGISKNTILASLKLLANEKIIARGNSPRQGYKVIQEPINYELEGENQSHKAVKFIMPFSYWNCIGNELLEGMEHTFSKNETSILFANHNNSIEKEELLLNRLITKSFSIVDALFLTVSRSVHNSNIELLNTIQDHFPLILVDRYIYGFSAHYIGVNNKKIGYEAALHLVNQGHTRMAFISGFGIVSTIKDRLEGFREGLLERNIELESSSVLVSPYCYKSLESTEKTGYDFGEKLFSSGGPSPTAVFCGSDKEAYGLLNYCRSHSIRIPEDLAIVGCDNDMFFGEKCQINLTTFDYPIKAIVHEMYNLFHQLKTTPSLPLRSIEFEAEFIRGESS